MVTTVRRYCTYATQRPINHVDVKMTAVNDSHTQDLMEIQSQRGRTLLLFKNYRYKQHNRKLTSGEIKWRCIKDSCKSFIHTLGESTDRIIRSMNDNHNHDPEQTNILERQKLSSSLKRKAQKNLGEKPSKIIREELNAQGTGFENLTSADLRCVKKNIYYARRQLNLVLPKSLEESTDCIIRSMNDNHNQDPEQNNILERQKLSSSVKREVQENYGEEPSKIIRGKLSAVNNSHTQDLMEIQSQRKRILLLFKNYRYKQHNRKLTSGEIKWKCIKDTCKSFIHTLGESTERFITSMNDNHNHDPEPKNNLERQKLSSSVKREVQENFGEEPSKITREELRAVNDSHTQDLMEIQSQRGRTLLLFKNYRYKQHNRKLTSGEIKWRCITDSCKSFIHTLGESTNRIITNMNDNHNHDPEPKNILERQKQSSSVKREVQENFGDEPSKIIWEELRAVNDSHTQDLMKIQSKRGKTLLLFNNYKFKQHNLKLSSGEIKWRCIKDSCKSFIQTLGESTDRIITTMNDNHNHDPEPKNILERQKLSSFIKRKAQENLEKEPSKIILGELRAQVTGFENLTSSNLRCIRKNIYYPRRQLNPDLPKTLGESTDCVVRTNNHKHDPEQNNILEAQKLGSSVKREVQENFGEDSSKIIRGKLSAVNNSHTQGLMEIQSQRGRTLLIFKNYRYKQHNRKLTSGEIKWKCIKDSCNSFIRTLGESTDRIIRSINDNHNHGPAQKNILERQKPSFSVKREVQENFEEEPSKIIRGKLSAINNSHTQDLMEIQSQRGRTLLLFKNYRYKQHNRKLTSGEIKWRCIKDSCKSFIHTLGESTDRIIRSMNDNHNHDPEQNNILERQKLSSFLKRKAQGNLGEEPSKILLGELRAQITGFENLTSADLRCVRKNLYYARRHLTSALPKSV